MENKLYLLIVLIVAFFMNAKNATAQTYCYKFYTCINSKGKKLNKTVSDSILYITFSNGMKEFHESNSMGIKLGNGFSATYDSIEKDKAIAIYKEDSLLTTHFYYFKLKDFSEFFRPFGYGSEFEMLVYRRF